MQTTERHFKIYSQQKTGVYKISLLLYNSMHLISH